MLLQFKGLFRSHLFFNPKFAGGDFRLYFPSPPSIVVNSRAPAAAEQSSGQESVAEEVKKPEPTWRVKKKMPTNVRSKEEKWKTQTYLGNAALTVQPGILPDIDFIALLLAGLSWAVIS